MNRRNAQSQDTDTMAAPTPDDTALRLADLEKRIAILEARPVVAEKPIVSNIRKEMTPNEHFAASNPIEQRRFVGPVPFNSKGEIGDPSWKLENGSYIQRDSADNIIQTVKA